MRLKAASTLALLAVAGACAAPLKFPTARPGTCLNSMNNEIKQADKPGQGYKLIFYGDSIFETLKGTDKCRECENPTRRSSCAGVPAVYRRVFGRFRPGVMAMSMDETAHLLYRLQHGAIPRRNKPRVAVLLIGTNDLTNSAWSARVQSIKEKALAKEVPGIVGRIEQAVQLLRRGAPRAKILVMGILPRGTGTGKGLPNAQNDFGWPSHYTKAIASINTQLRGLALRNRGSVSFLDCGRVFLRGAGIDARLMADSVHPTAAGWEKLAACMLPRVRQLMK